jgi:hypothetical protein
MTTPGLPNTSSTARLMIGAPSFAVGWQERVLIPPPPAGQAFTYTGDGRYFERIIAVTFTLVTSVVVANRLAQMVLQNTDGVVITAAPGGGAVVASSTLNVFLTNDAPAYSGGISGATFGKIPDILIPPGWKWVCQVSGIDVADQLSNIVVLVQRFPNDAASISAVG